RSCLLRLPLQDTTRPSMGAGVAAGVRPLLPRARLATAERHRSHRPPTRGSEVRRIGVLLVLSALEHASGGGRLRIPISTKKRGQSGQLIEECDEVAW